MIGRTLSADGGTRCLWPVAAAVAVTVAVVAWLLSGGVPEADPDEPGAPIDGLAPAGELQAAPTVLTWAPVEGATAYTVRVADADAVWPVFVRTASGPAWSLDASDRTALAVGRDYEWEVRAQDAAGRVLATGSARFRIRRREG